MVQDFLNLEDDYNNVKHKHSVIIKYHQNKVIKYKSTLKNIVIENKNIKESDLNESRYLVEEYQREVEKVSLEFNETVSKLNTLDIDNEFKERCKRLNQNLLQIRVNLENEINNEEQGLTAERIQQFHHFAADELLVGEQCSICMEDIEIGRKMMRLNCDGQHTFCQVCIERWFADHNTCPNCRHVFSNNSVSEFLFSVFSTLVFIAIFIYFSIV